MLAKINPISPRGIIPMPISNLSDVVPVVAQPDASLQTIATTDSVAAERDRVARAQRGEVGIDAHENEEHRNEDVADHTEVAGDSFRLIAATDRDTGHKRADDEHQICGVGERAEAQGDDECSDRCCSR